MALTRISNDTLQDATITQTKLGTEFTTSIEIPLGTDPGTGTPVNVFPQNPPQVISYEGTSIDSSILIQLGSGPPPPTIAANQLIGANFDWFQTTFIGSIGPGSYIIGSNYASFVDGNGITNIELILNPTEQTDPVGGSLSSINDRSVTINQTPPDLQVDFSSAQIFTKTLTANENIVFTNYTTGAVKDLLVTGDFTLGFTTGTVNTAAGEYDGTVSNLIQVICVDATTPTFWVTISQPQV
ncbi:hypothetical protein N9980_01000 [bacterium]|nr:hypothetical protein [bacterium]